MSNKKRLNLTILEDIKVKARVLASKRRRSVSGFFEDLIEEEWDRLPDSSKEKPMMVPIKKVAQLGAGHDERRGRSRLGKTSRGDRRSNEG